jgi:hypothetical protein
MGATEEQRRERARQAILEAFARPPRVVEGEYKVIAGKDVLATDEQANGEASEERKG